MTFCCTRCSCSCDLSVAMRCTTTACAFSRFSPGGSGCMSFLVQYAIIKYTADDIHLYCTSPQGRGSNALDPLVLQKDRLATRLRLSTLFQPTRTTSALYEANIHPNCLVVSTSRRVVLQLGFHSWPPSLPMCAAHRHGQRTHLMFHS